MGHRILMAAPAFVPKEEAEDLVVPEVSGLSVTEMKAMKEEADEPAVSRNSGASKGG